MPTQTPLQPKVGDYLCHSHWNLVKVVKEYRHNESVCQVLCFLPAEKRMLLRHELLQPFAEERIAPVEGVGCAQCHKNVQATAHYLKVGFSGDKELDPMSGVLCMNCWQLVINEIVEANRGRK